MISSNKFTCFALNLKKKILTMEEIAYVYSKIIIIFLK